MLTYITGVPGAGKTYYAVYKIFDLKDNYSYVYTNIHLKEYTDNIKYFDFDKFYSVISTAYSMYLNKCSDSDINEYLKSEGYHKVFLVVDEAHNFFGKKDDVLIWFLTYHRHLYFDIFFVTQSLDLIDKKYLSLGEIFVKAVQSSLRLAPNYFFYNKYPNYKMQEKFETEKLPKKKEIFEKYTSGDVVRSSNIILRFSLIFVIFFILAIVFFLFLKIFFFSSKSNDNVSSLDSNVSSSNVSESRIVPNVPRSVSYSSPLSSIVNSSNDTNFTYLIFYCPSKYCFLNDKKVSLSFLYHLIKTRHYSVFIDEPYLYIKSDRLLSRLFVKENREDARGVGGVRHLPDFLKKSVRAMGAPQLPTAR